MIRTNLRQGFGGQAPLAAPARPGCAARILAAMAETMNEIAFAGGAVSGETLCQHGYTPAAVLRFGQAATIRARRNAVRQIARISGAPL